MSPIMPNSGRDWGRITIYNIQQSTLDREEFVYNEIMKNKGLFNDGEILFSQKYIYKLRNGEWPPPGWKGFEKNE